MDAGYAGCIEAAGAGKFTLAHAVAATDAMGANSMKEPSTKNDMAMDTMKKDSRCPRRLRFRARPSISAST
jgi:hypothetical protein